MQANRIGGRSLLSGV